MTQEERDAHWMRHALLLAAKAEEAGEVPVGAVIVSGNEILAEGRNQPIESNDPSAHAELVALRSACAQVQNYRLPADTTLYVTLEPCPMCAGALVHGRIGRVVFAAPDPRTGAAGSVFDLLNSEMLNHRAEVTGGVLQEESAQMLRTFFKSRR